MSQQNGVPFLASIEPTPPSHPPNTSNSHPSIPPFNASTDFEESSFNLPSNSNLPSSISASKVQIPKLSAATTELLARVTGSIKDERRDDNFAWNQSPYNQDLNDWASGQTNNMKGSSAIIDFPTAPFVGSNTAAASDIQHLPGVSHDHLNSSGLLDIAPKPLGIQPAPPTTTQIPPPSQFQPSATILKTTQPDSLLKRQKPAASRQRRSLTKGTRPRGKRRRGDGSDGEVIRAEDSSSDESDVAPTATQTKSGRQVHRPSLYVPPPTVSPGAGKDNTNSLDTSDNAPPQTVVSRKRKRFYRKGKELSVNCMHCQRGHSPLTNTIVFCDECNRAWHQLCHDPPIDNEVVTVKEKEWLCRNCKPVPQLNTQPTVVRSNPSQPPPPFHPSNRPPLAMPNIEVGGEGFSVDERRGYLSALSHATLVELLVTISDHHPSVPMFPEDMRALQSSQFSFDTSTPMAPAASLPEPTNSVSANSVPEFNKPLLPTEGIEQQNGTLNSENLPSSTSSQKKKKREDSPAESEYEEFEDHRLYPRAGNGFRLPLNIEDLDIMRDDPACPTFRYGLHGPAKARAEANEIAPVWTVA